MGQWDDPVRRDHRALADQLDQLEAVLELGEAEAEYLVIVRSAVRGILAMLEPHMGREEQFLFPVLRRLLGREAHAIALLEVEHHALRTHLRALTGRLEHETPHACHEIAEEGRRFIQLLRDHEKTEDRLLLDVLHYSLSPTELDTISRAFANEPA